MKPTANSTDLSDADFKTIANIAYKDAGLVFLPEKASLVKSRINKRLQKLKFNSFSEYASFVSSEQGRCERKIMISSLTTNVSNFFREPHHFSTLKMQVLPDLLKRARAGERIRIWSAGCSTGQEPYSIAMTLLDHAPDAGTLDIKILATDIDPAVIITARNGIYDERDTKDIETSYQEKYIDFDQAKFGKGFSISESVRDLVTFRELNLLSKWPISGLFDIIFCRNVVIYFDEKTQLSLWPKFESVTAPDGWLFVGHSERLSDKLETNFTTAGLTAYRNLTPILP